MHLITDIFYSRSFISTQYAARGTIDVALDSLYQLGQFFSCQISNAYRLASLVPTVLTACVTLLAFRCSLVAQGVFFDPMPLAARATLYKNLRVLTALHELGVDLSDPNYFVAHSFMDWNEGGGALCASLRVLGQIGVDFDKASLRRDPLCHIALDGKNENECIEVLKVLKEFRADFSVCDRAGQTLVQKAKSKNQSQVLSYLKSIGVNAPVAQRVQPQNLEQSAMRQASTNSPKVTPKVAIDPATAFAEKHGRKEINEGLKGRNLLHKFVKEGDLVNIQIALALGANVNAPDRQGLTPSHEAVIEGNFQALELLANAGADFNQKQADGWTPLHIAFSQVKAHGIQMIEVLKKHGARFDAQDNLGRVPIFCLLSDLNKIEEERLASLFAIEPAMLNTQGCDGNTLVHFAVKIAPSLLPLLSRFSPDMSIQNREEKTPRQVFASLYGLEDIDSPYTENALLVHLFIQGNDLDKLKVLALLGANFNVVVAKSTPLIFALICGNAAAIEVLVEGGADPNLEIEEGMTPSHFAITHIKKSGVVQCLKLLHRLGANLYAQDASGKPPIHCLREGVEENIVQELFGIDPQLICSQNREGETLAHLMAKKKRLVLFFALLKKAGMEQNSSAFFVQDRDGNTALHIVSLEEVRPFLENIHEDALEIRNAQGWRPIDYWHYSASLSWLTKVKVVREDVVLSEREFKARAKALRKNVLALWDSLFLLPFGKGICKASRNIFSLTRRGALVLIPPSQVRAALTVMLNRIVEKALWLGTPRADQLQELHSFYTHMLVNFEQIVESLQREEESGYVEKQVDLIGGQPRPTHFFTSAWNKVAKRASLEGKRRPAGLKTELLRNRAKTLFEVAIPQLDGRCAAAYQEDIEQIAEIGVADVDELTVQALLEKNVALFLGRVADSVIEASSGIFGGAHDNSAHVRPQLRFLLGLRSLPDPMGHHPLYSNLALQCVEEVKKRWVFPQLLTDLREIFKELPTDSILFWLRDQISDEFSIGHVSLKEEAEAREQEVQQRTRGFLLESDLSEEQAGEVLQFFTSANGASCPLIHKEVFTQEMTPRQLIISFLGVLESCGSMQFPLPQVTEMEEILATKQLDSEESWQEAFDEIKGKMRLPEGQERLTVQQRAMWGRGTALFIKAVLTRQKAQQELLKYVPQERLQQVLEVKHRYDEEMKAVSFSLMDASTVVSINLQAYGLASAAIEQERRLAFEIEHVEEVEIRRTQIVEGQEKEVVEYKRIPNQKGAMLIALHLGLIEECRLD